MTKTIAVLVPTGKPLLKEIPISPRVDDLNNKVVGFWWNGKPNGDILLKRIKEQLSRRFHFAETHWYPRHEYTTGADFAAIAEITHNSDMVIIGQGD